MRRLVTLISVMVVVFAAVAAHAQSASDSTAAPAAKSPPPETAPAEAAAPAASNAVKRAVFCTGVAEREPVDEITTLAPPAEKVYFFTEIIGMEGKTIKHRWMHGGQMVAEVPITIGSARWRCYSTKSMSEGTTGSWTVEIVDDAGTKLGEATLTYGAAQ